MLSPSIAGRCAQLAVLATLFLAVASQAEVISRIPAGRSKEAGQGWLLVSPDGYHYAYLSLTPTEGEVVVKDGRVVAREERRAFSSIIVENFGHRVLGALGNNGRLVLLRQVLGPHEGSVEGIQVWQDGKGGPVYKNANTPVMTPDGRHLAFAAETEDGWHAVFDGVPGPAFASAPHDITISPAGSQAAYLADDGGTALYIGAKKIRRWNVAQILFSPDWSRVAWVSRSADDSGDSVGIDDARLGYFPGLLGSVADLQFSPDGRRLFYVGYVEVASPKEVSLPNLYVDGQKIAGPWEEYQSLVISPAGIPNWFLKSGGSLALYRNGTPAGRCDSVTGTPALAFSPSGAHSAYAAHRAGARWLVVDDKAQPGGPDALPDGVGIVFDNEREFHYLDGAKGAFDLVCVAVGRAPADSACVRKARAIYPGAADSE